MARRTRTPQESTDEKLVKITEEIQELTLLQDLMHTAEQHPGWEVLSRRVVEAHEEKWTKALRTDVDVVHVYQNQGKLSALRELVRSVSALRSRLHSKLEERTRLLEQQAKEQGHAAV